MQVENVLKNMCNYNRCIIIIALTAFFINIAKYYMLDLCPTVDIFLADEDGDDDEYWNTFIN